MSSELVATVLPAPLGLAAGTDSGPSAGPPQLAARVLLVDDEQSIAKLGKMILEGAGCRVTACADSNEAWALFSAAPAEYDVVITDQTMPGLTGTDLAARMLTRRDDLPIILISGYSDVLFQEEAAASGIPAFLMKPLTLAELTIAIKTAISGQPLN